MLHLYSENEWIFPDTLIEHEQVTASLHAAKGGSVCVQLLTDKVLTKDEACAVSVCNARNIRVTAYQLIPATVDLNSARDVLCTKNYDEVKDFVTKKAPFDVYDATRPLNDGILKAGRVALYLRFDVPQDAAAEMTDIGITFQVGGEEFGCNIMLTVHNCTVPDVAHAKFGQINWMYMDKMDQNHNLTKGEKRREDVLRAYLRNQIDMRNTDFKLPSADVRKDADGKVIGFDFTDAEFVGNLALEMGFRHILGGFVARFVKWDDPNHYLLWDRSVSIVSVEGYRQLKLYFEGAKACAEKNGWGDKYQQCLVDEPQFPNSEHYRILCAICRKFLPGTVIHDPVESTELMGGTDIWCIKQAVYEKYIDDYRKLQEIGEPIWLYTCGYPAGYTMNRAMDLPLTASRLPFWMCVLYGAAGFLH